MFPGHLTLRRTPLLLAAAWLALPATVWAWGGATHHYIAENYSQHLPPYIDGLRVYDSVVDQKVTDPDTRKSYTPGESYRHFLDIDYYPEFQAGTLTHDRAALEAEYGAATVLNNGILPWAVDDVVNTLSQQFQAQAWSAAATTIADLCHYVGDATQPLHCTQNFDGQYTGNGGVHARYETTMMQAHLTELHTAPMTVTYYPNVVDAMFGIIDDSWTGVATILNADDAARTAGAGTSSPTYYAALWDGTQTLTRRQIDEATLATASFVYTAWINAGQPNVPGSTSNVGGAPNTQVRFDAGPSPFRDALTIHYGGAGPVNVEVFDVRGTKIARLVSGAVGQGTATWRPGGGVNAGLYFIRYRGPGRELVRRVTLLK